MMARSVEVLVIATLVIAASASPSTNNIHASSNKLKGQEKSRSAADAGEATFKFLAKPVAAKATSLVSNSSEDAATSGVQQLPTLPAASKDAKEDAMTMSSMESAITDLMLGKSAFGATPMGGSVKKIARILTNTMMPKVVAAHNADQRQLRRLASEISKCGSTKNSALRGANTELSKFRRDSRYHKSCRADEAVKYSSKRNCEANQRSKYAVKQLKCKAFASMSKQYGTTKNNQAIVNKAGGESVQSYLGRLSRTFCGSHVHGSNGRRSRTGGRGGGLPSGMLDKYLRAKDACQRANRDYGNKVKECRRKSHYYFSRRGKCNQYQTTMDSAACKRAVIAKDACESYAECYYSKVKAYRIVEGKVRFEERDRKAEWRGLKRMKCLIDAFADGKVSNKEVDTCKRMTVSTKFLTVKYPRVPRLVKCTVPTLYPSTGAYKRAEFARLPSVAKGKQSAECSGVQEISTRARAGSPKSCKCRRVTLNGHYSAGPMVKCTNCRDVRRSQQTNSCPSGTKIFSPRTRADWKTFLSSARPLNHPHFIVDVTRPQNGCGGCRNPMNSGNRYQKSWRTSDGSPWWFRNSRFGEPNGDYNANCFLHLYGLRNENDVRFNDARCNYHSRSYYCQPKNMNLKPGAGSPRSCKCTKVELTGRYSAGSLVRCEQCTTVYRSTQRNSCPAGMKIFSPRSRADWRTFLKSAGPLRAPHWIIDVTRPQNGCGGCTRYPMKSTHPRQATWRTSDGSPWWLRDSRYSEPNGDYYANCFMDLWRKPANENHITMNDYRCHYRSRSYYCQPKMVKRKRVRRARPTPARTVINWGRLRTGLEERVFYFRHGLRRVPNLNRNPQGVRRVGAVNYGSTGGYWSGLRQRDRFGVRWSGVLVINRPGNYRLFLISDDGSKMWINNRYVLNNDGLHGMRRRDTIQRLVKGQHWLRIDFFENGGGAGCKFYYRGADTGNRDRIVSGNALRYVYQKGFKEEVHYNMRGLRNVPNLNRSPSLVRVVRQVVYGNTNRRWPGFHASQNFAVRWTGTLQIYRGGTYRWSLGSDDGSNLFLNGRYVVNNNGLHGFRWREANYRVGGRLGIRLEFFERGGHAGMLFRYMGPDTGNRMRYVERGRMLPAF